MPNYITNILCLEGKKEFLEKILSKSNKFSFSSSVPTPQNNSKPRMSLNDSLSDWFVDNWGTKWDAINPIIHTRKSNKIILTFNTAWSPPDKWLKHIHSKFPEIKFYLVWADEDFPSSGYICTQNDSKKIKSVEFKHDDPKALEFVKTYFPEFYEINIEEKRIFLITKKISQVLTKYFKSVKKTIGNFDKTISNLEVYSSSSDSFSISVLEKLSYNSWINIFSKLRPDGKKLLLEKAQKLLKNEGIECRIKKDSLVIIKK